MKTHGAPMNHLKLRTGPVFANALDPLGELWTTISDLEDQLGKILLRRPEGTVVSSGGLGWQLTPPSETGLVELVGGAMEAGELSAPTSRFDIGLDWVDVEEMTLQYQIDRLNDVLGMMEATATQ